MMKQSVLVVALFFISSCSPGGLFQQDPSRPMTYTETRATGDVVESLIRYFQKNHPDVAGALRPPVSATALDQFETKVGRPLPQDFRVLYLSANGQKSGSLPVLLNGYELLSLEEIEIHWLRLKSSPINMAGAEMPSRRSRGPVRDFWWHPMWIPFAKTAQGDYYCLDLFPSRRGRIGQVIEFRKDDVLRRHKGFSVNDFLGEYESGLKSGRYSWNPDLKMFLGRRNRK